MIAGRMSSRDFAQPAGGAAASPQGSPIVVVPNMGAALTIGATDANYEHEILRWMVPDDLGGPVLLELTANLTPSLGQGTFLIYRVTHGPRAQGQTRDVYGAFQRAASGSLTKRTRIPLCASQVIVTARIEGVAAGQMRNVDGNDAAAQATITATLMRGIDGQERASSIWVPANPNAPLGASFVVAARPGAVLRAQGYAATGDGARRYVMFFDATATPPNNTAPVISFPVEDGAAFSYDVRDTPDDHPRFGTGIMFATSSTPGTLTLDASAEIRIDTQIER